MRGTLHPKGTEAADRLNREVSLSADCHLITTSRRGPPHLPLAPEYIDAVQEPILENLDQFLGCPSSPAGSRPTQPQALSSSSRSKR